MSFAEAVRRHCEAIRHRCEDAPVATLRPKLTPFGT